MKVERHTVHLSDDTGRIAMLEKRTLGTDPSPASLLRYIYSNHLQSASLELDENAAIISYEEYHPYGTTSYQAMNTAVNAVAKRYRYTGKERDEESGLYYHGARYYISWLCRWTAVDPLESKYAGMSPYNYAFNNPVMYNDPSGADPNDPPKGNNVDNATSVVKQPASQLYSAPNGDILELPTTANVKSYFDSDVVTYSDGKIIHPADNSVWTFAYKDETYMAQFDASGGFTHYQSLSNSEHRLGLNENTTPKIDPNQTRNEYYELAVSSLSVSPADINPYIKGAILIYVAYLFYRSATAADALDLPIGIYGPSSFSYSFDDAPTKPMAIPIPSVDAKVERTQEIRIALSVEEYLWAFAIQKNALPYKDWPGGQPAESTPSAYRSAIITLGMNPNVTFHMNVSRENGGYVFDPRSGKYNTSVTSEEFRTVYSLFKNRTTFYEKSGSTFKPIHNIDKFMQNKLKP